MINIEVAFCGGSINKDKDDVQHDIIDDDLYEDIDDEEMAELVKEAREQLLQQKEEPVKKRKILKWSLWLIAIALVINLIAVLPQTFSIPAIDFLVTSAKLSTDEKIK